MKRIGVVALVGGAILLLLQYDLVARGPIAGGGGRVGGGGAAAGAGAARAGGGGGAAAGAAGRSPALAGGGASAAARPNVGANNVRPNVGAGAARPTVGDAGASRPAISPGAGANIGNHIGAGSNIGANIGTRPNIGVGSNIGTGANIGAGANVAAGNRPSASQLHNFLDIPRASTGAIGAGGEIGAGRGGAAADFLQLGNRPTQLPAGGAAIVDRPTQLPAGGAAIGERPTQLPAGGIGNRPTQLPAGPIAGRPGVPGSGIGSGAASNLGNHRQNFADNRPNRIENRQQLQNNRQQRRDDVRHQVATNYPRLNFWHDHPNWARWRINAPYRWATWTMLTGWFGWGAAPATTYAYGDNVYYVNNQVYYGDAPVATADAYAAQAAAIVASAPQNLDPQSSEWLPLGVFAVTQDNEAVGPDPSLFVQLAVDKNAVISGTFKNMATGDVQSLEGMIDKQSQRAAWGVEGKAWPIVETGLSNLTQDTVPVLVHFADGQTQQWLLVRLDEPKQP